MASTIWRGRLSFGLVSIPVRIYKAARRERVRFRQVFRPESAPIPPENSKIHSISRHFEPETAPKSPSEPPPQPIETVERVRNLPVADTAETPVERPQILK